MIALEAKHTIVLSLVLMETIGLLSTLRNNSPTAVYAYGQDLGNSATRIRPTTSSNSTAQTTPATADWILLLNGSGSAADNRR